MNLYLNFMNQEKGYDYKNFLLTFFFTQSWKDHDRLIYGYWALENI